MGLLSEHGPQSWHPAQQEIKDTCRTAVQYAKTHLHQNLSKLALCYALSDPFNVHIASTIIGTNESAIMKQNIAWAEEIFTLHDQCQHHQHQTKDNNTNNNNHYHAGEIGEAGADNISNTQMEKKQKDEQKQHQQQEEQLTCCWWEVERYSQLMKLFEPIRNKIWPSGKPENNDD